MRSMLTGNVICPGKYNNYLVGGNICNAFAIGELGSETDFFLLGTEPAEESSYPMLTGNILDSEGNVLFRLVRNMLVVNPGNCSKITSDRVGYEIHDGNDKLIFKVSTSFEELPGRNEKSFVTRMSANFYNKNGELVFEAGSDAGDESIQSSVKSVFGYAGGFGLVLGLNDTEMKIASILFQSEGRINRVITGDIVGKDVTLDGAAILQANISQSRVTIATGDFIIDDASFNTCNFSFTGAADNVRKIVMMLQNQPKKTA